MRLTLSLVSLLSLIATTAPAQTTQISTRFGWLMYDAGGDSNYPTFQLAIERTVSPHLRIGFQGSWAHVGDVPRSWTVPGSDERVLRGVATLGYAAGRLFGDVPVLEHLRPVFTAGIGLVHSAGVRTDFSDFVGDPFFGITDQRTGVTYGAGLTLEVPLADRASITGSLQFWRDNLYGGRLHNFDQVLGLAWRF